MEIVPSKRKKTNPEAKEYFFNNYDSEVDINKVETAKSLGVTRQTIYRWINEIKRNKKTIK